MFVIRFKLVETAQQRAVNFSQPKRQHRLPFASRSGQNRHTARRVHRVAGKSLMLSFEKFAGAGVRPLQPPLFSVFPQSATVLGGCAGGALSAKADETSLNRSWHGFTEGFKTKIKPVRSLKCVLDNYNYLSSNIYSNGAQAVVIWFSRRFATLPSARASPQEGGRILREIDPVSEHYVAEPLPARHHLQNGMKTRSKKLPSWFSTKEGSRSLNGTIFSTKIALCTITKNRFFHLRLTTWLRQTLHPTQRLGMSNMRFSHENFVMKFAMSSFKMFFELYSNI